MPKAREQQRLDLAEPHIFYNLARGSLREQVLAGKISQQEYWRRHAQLIEAVRAQGGVKVPLRLNANDLVVYGRRYLERDGSFLHSNERPRSIRRARTALDHLDEKTHKRR